MADKAQDQTVNDRNINHISIAFMLGLFAIVIFATGQAKNFVASERARALQEWQTRLDIVADSRKDAIERWLYNQEDVLRSLASNVPLQLYLSQIIDEETHDSFEVSSLRSLLSETGRLSSFVLPRQYMKIKANVSTPYLSGLALTDTKGNVLVSTSAMPEIPASIKEILGSAESNNPAKTDMYKGYDDLPTMAFAVPVYPVQMDGSGSQNIGYIIGIKVLDDAFFSLLSQPGEAFRNAENYLIRAQGDEVEYISPLQDGTKAFGKTRPFDVDRYVGPYLIANKGQFGVGQNYNGRNVLVTGRTIDGLHNWMLVRSVGRAEALGNVERRLDSLLVVLMLSILGVGLTMAVIWKHSASVKAARAAMLHSQAVKQLRQVSEFLNLVSNSQLSQIFVVNREGKITFANQSMAKSLEMHLSDIPGKTLFDVMGAEKASSIESLNKDAIVSGEYRIEEHEFFGRHQSSNLWDGVPGEEDIFNRGGSSLEAVGVDTKDDDEEKLKNNSFAEELKEIYESQVMVSNHIPLKEPGKDKVNSVLVTLHDVSDIMYERRKHEQSMREIVKALINILDGRDPYSAQHSVRVAEVAVEIAKEMGLNDDVVELVDIAGSLMNTGKIFIPRSLLIKKSVLTHKEKEQVQNALAKSAEVISGITFDVPVMETVQQSKEKWDGSGPNGLTGMQIPIGARIVAIADSFVAMVSSRAYREEKTFEQTCEILMGDSGKKYDPKAAAALLNIIQNRNAEKMWGHFKENNEIKE
ncbi:MAG: HD domain-containing protein [Alphaproteobacteria bacterium]|nr:HD domain-containing protein [Alphaproteobacteria bacterium]